MSLHVPGSGSRNESSADSSDSEEQEQDEASSTNKQQETVEDVLTNFREKWQKELQISPKENNTTVSHKSSDEVEHDFETTARVLFMKGVELEKSGKLYEAIQFYRKAVQLVPDIEFRLHNSLTKLPIREKIADENREIVSREDQDSISEDSDESDDDGIPLFQKIQRKLEKESAICIPNLEQKTAHISVLPMEMILYVLRWVVSSDLDLRSLEMFSRTCRGFYLCARDSEIWRLACLRIWGLSCGSSPHNYPSWRHMFIERTRLHFNGCYIGKTTYIRHGESSFQDQFYRPWHLVTYYRYFRFFAEGLVLVLTSSDEPAQCVGQLKYRNPRPHILQGYYRLKDDKVTLVVRRQDKQNGFQTKKPNKRRTGADLHEVANQTFHMELQIKTVNKKRHIQLVWTHYSVLTKTNKGDESTCNFDLVNNRFPPLWFSRVKSYTSESESPLQ